MEGLLVQQAKLIGLDLPKIGGKLPFGAVYAVGDNPASDIAGARAAGNFLFSPVPNCADMLHFYLFSQHSKSALPLSSCSAYFVCALPWLSHIWCCWWVLTTMTGHSTH